MKQLLRYSSLFLCLLALTACQEAKEKPAPRSSSASTSESKSSSSSTSASQSSSSSTSSPAESSTEPAPTPESSSTPATTGMDIAALQKQDYTSIAGTWQDEQGNTFVFDANGLVHEHYQVNPMNNATIENGVLSASYMPKTSPVGSGMIKFAPKGSSFPTGVDGLPDASDSTRDRIWMGQQGVFSNPATFYYRVE